MCDAYCSCNSGCPDTGKGKGKGGKAGSGKAGSGKAGSGKSGKGDGDDRRRELFEVERRLCPGKAGKGGKSGGKSGGKTGSQGGKGKGSGSDDDGDYGCLAQAAKELQDMCDCTDYGCASSVPSSVPSAGPSMGPSIPPVAAAIDAPEASAAVEEIFEARQTCVQSHTGYSGIRGETYGELAGWCYEFTTDTKLFCRDENFEQTVFNMGWNEVSERGFDNLVYMCLDKDPVVLSDGAFCDEDFEVEVGCKVRGCRAALQCISSVLSHLVVVVVVEISDHAYCISTPTLFIAARLLFG